MCMWGQEDTGCPYSLEEDFPLNLGSTIFQSAKIAGQQAVMTLCLPHAPRGAGVTATLGLYMGAGDPSGGPHACIASVLTLSISPAPASQNAFTSHWTLVPTCGPLLLLSPFPQKSGERQKE